MSREPLKNGLLLRQVHPIALERSGRLTSTAFTPKKGDEGELSVDQEELTTRADSFHRFEQNFKKRAAGTLGVLVSECDEAAKRLQVSVQVLADPVPGNSAHAIIDMASLSRRKTEKVAKALKFIAAERGWLYPPEMPGEKVIT